MVNIITYRFTWNCITRCKILVSNKVVKLI